MLGRTYDKEVCSAARALEIVGERWSLLILRNAAFAGMTRFTDFQKSLDIAPNVLAARLERFVEEGLMTTTGGAEGFATYHLTKKGLDFKPVIIANFLHSARILGDTRLPWHVSYRVRVGVK